MTTPNTLAQSLYEATLQNDPVEVDRIKGEIEKRADSLKPKVKENVINFNTVLNNDESSAKSIYIFLNKEFGEDWWEWEFETLERMLWLKFSVALEDINRDKVFAIRHLCRSDQAFFDWFEFNQACLSLSGSIADFEMIKKPSPGMIINAVKTMNFIRPERESNFGNDTIKYICICLKDDGLYLPPVSMFDMLKVAFSELVSEEMKAQWKSVYEKYRQIVSHENEKIEETEIDIQARRLISAEAAAASYFN
jgi:hypothetical protein